MGYDFFFSLELTVDNATCIMCTEPVNLAASFVEYRGYNKGLASAISLESSRFAASTAESSLKHLIVTCKGVLNDTS